MTVGDARLAIQREGMARKDMPGVRVRARGIGQPAVREVQRSNLRVMPGQRFWVARARGLERHLHQVERTGEVALQFARVRHAGVRGGIRPQRQHAIERSEGPVVIAELQMRVADDPVRPRVVRAHLEAALGCANRVAEAMLGQEHGGEQAARLVVLRIVREDLREHGLGAHGEPRIAGDARQPEQGIRQRDGRRRILRAPGQAGLHCRHRLREIVPARARRVRRSERGNRGFPCGGGGSLVQDHVIAGASQTTLITRAVFTLVHG